MSAACVTSFKRPPIQWAPFPREVALAELAKRYFTSHGQATVQDYAWWSGLPVGSASAGIDMSNAHLVTAVIDGHSGSITLKCTGCRSRPSGMMMWFSICAFFRRPDAQQRRPGLRVQRARLELDADAAKRLEGVASG